MNYDWTILALATAGAFFMAFNNGANDVANSFASAVGSKALELNQALVISSIVTFLGAVLLGSNVALRLVEGVIEPSLFASSTQYCIAMLAVLVASGTFVLFSTLTGMPVSSTHSIVGGLTGVGIAVTGWESVKWASLAKIALSWIISPLLAGFMTLSMINLITMFIIGKNKNLSLHQVRLRLTLLITTLVTVGLWGTINYTAMAHTLSIVWQYQIAIYPTIFGLLFVLFWRFINLWTTNSKGSPRSIQAAFRRLQVGTSCYVAFGNGANDVANSISPMFAILIVTSQGSIPQHFTDGRQIPLWILALGGLGIVSGITVLGKNVMRTLGEKITTISNSSGFSIDFSVATTIVAASIFGLPISTTHAATGAIVGAGLTKRQGLHLGLLGRIVIAWIITVPCAALIAIVIYKTINWVLF